VTRFLLDTNVLAEAAKAEPDAPVVAWLRAQSALDLAISVLTLGEIRKGVALLPPGPRRTALEHWLAVDLPRQFTGRVLPVDEAAARAWGDLAAGGRRLGRELPVIDGLLLATAAVHGLTLVTRDEADCADRGVPVLNPWR
jgi:predicted nucleic acid-binding protein